jgi:DNA invertase Pin-like site-specific DNA recombinase
MLALGYSCSSSATRLDDADLKAQVEAVKRFCTHNGWELTAMVHEVEPRRRYGRPALRYAIDRLERGPVTCLVVSDLGRLCKSITDLRTVLDALDRVDGARLISLQPPIDTGTERGRETIAILRLLSDWERARAAERSRKGLEAAQAKGAVQPKIKPALKRQIARMRGAGMTLQAIVDELNEAGVPTVRGGAKWRVSSVQAALGYKRPART